VIVPRSALHVTEESEAFVTLVVKVRLLPDVAAEACGAILTPIVGGVVVGVAAVTSLGAPKPKLLDPVIWKS
jgi:hypothetical protein